MAKEMLINVSEGEECRIAVLENGKLEELYMERSSSALHVGNIYKGKVTNVEPSIQAAFVDFGLGRNGFLHISDLMPSYFGQGNEDVESVGRKMSRRDRPPIQRCLRRGDEIVVQIIKEGIGTKGPTLSTYLSVPGQILVMMPGMAKMGISKKIEDETERKRLRTILDGLKPPKDCGFIIRTSGVGRTKTEIERDLKYLARLWEQLKKKEASGKGPMELYTEGDLVTRTVRDVFSTDIDRIIVDSKDVAKRVKEVIKITSPRTKNKVELFDEGIPLFHKYNIEKEIELMYSRHVPLPSGGSLVIDSTEAIVAIDVNSGKFRDHSDAETTAFKTDMEAADEIPRQLKLRDLGGVIICDFIDLRFDRHRRELEHRLHENFKKDRAKTKVLRMSQFGIIELTRQRMRPSLKRSIYFDCPHCKGAGLVKTPESMSLDVMRRIAIAMHDERVVRVEVSVHPDVGFYLQNKKRAALSEMEDETKKRVVVRGDTQLALDEIKWQLFDTRDGMVVLEAIGMTAMQPHQQQGRQQGRDRRDRGRDRHQHGQRHQPPARAMETEDERFDIEAGDEHEDHGERKLPAPQGREERQAEEPAESAEGAAQGEVHEGEIVGEGNEQGGGRRRRRRRRGRRGRGGNGGQHQGQGGQGPGGQNDRYPAMLENNGDQDVEVFDNEEQQPESNERPPARREQPQSRGRDRSRQRDQSRQQPQRQQPPAPQPIEAAEDVVDESAPEPGNELHLTEEEGGKRRRRRRGGRRHRRGRGQGGEAQNGGEAPAESDSGSSEQESEPVQAKTIENKPKYPIAPPKIEQAPVVRTGSTDRHLVSDTPIEPQPLRRPRSYNDLDAIPDDFD